MEERLPKKKKKAFGKEGQGPGEFISSGGRAEKMPRRISISRNTAPMIAVQKFTSDGKISFGVRAFGTKPGEFQRPSGLVWRDGKIYAADAFNNRIQVLLLMENF